MLPVYESDLNMKLVTVYIIQDYVGYKHRRLVLANFSVI